MGLLDRLLGGNNLRKAEEDLRKQEQYVRDVTLQSRRKQYQQGKIGLDQLNQATRDLTQQNAQALPQLSQWEKRNAALADAAARNRIINPVLGGLAEGNIIKRVGDLGQLGAGAARFVGQNSVADAIDRRTKPMANFGKVDTQGSFRPTGKIGDTLIRGGVQLATDLPFYATGVGGAAKAGQAAKFLQTSKNVSRVARAVPVVGTFGNVANNQYQNSRQAGVNDRKAFISGVGLGGASAALEKMGLGKVVKPTGRLTSNLITRTIGAGLTEGATEGGQQLLENAVAKNTYDPRRSYGQGVAQAALAGGLLGGAARGAVEVGNLRTPEGRVQARAEMVSPAASSIKNDPVYVGLESRITRAVMEATKPNTPFKLKANYLQEARDLIRQRNEYVGGNSQGGYLDLPFLRDPNSPEATAMARGAVSGAPDVQPRDAQPLETSASVPRGKNANQQIQPQEATALPQTGKRQIAVNDTQSPLANNTPKQLELKDSTTPFTNEQNTVVNDYAKMLKGMEDGLTGGEMIQDGEGGYKRSTQHSKFYSDYYAANKRKPSKEAWLEEAKRQLESGSADSSFQEAFSQLQDPEYRSLVQSQERATAPTSIGDKVAGTLVDATAKVKQPSRESNIPVRVMKQDGDTVTATNVNPNIKAKEKRYALDDEGNLKEDKKGAYSLFTDEDGKIEGFRVGNEYYNAKDLGDVSEVNNYSSTIATMRRNIERSFGKDTGEKVNKFLVDDQQARATSMIERQVNYNKEMQNVADDLGIKFSGLRGKKAKQVSADIQNFGEGAITRAELDTKYGKEYAQKIVNADKWFRKQYDSLLNEMNTTLTKYGYDPVPKRKNYYTHFQDQKLWEKFGLRMQEIRNLASPTMQDASPDKARGSISNALAGESEFTQPNKRFNPFALQRKGNKYTADAFQSFEKYLSPTLNNIYMTPSITKARVLAKVIANDADLAGKDANGVIVQIKEYANNLSGKSSRIGDRFLSDTKMGKQYLAVANWAQKKAGQNTIVGNLSTAALQPIVLAQTAGKYGYKNTIVGAMQLLAGKTPIGQSQFMRRRYADTTSVLATSMDKARNVANKPLEIVEKTAAQITWNAAYNDAVARGRRGKEAIRYADIEAEKTLAGRSIGEKPELYRSKAAGPFTMYQLEVNNYWQQFMKEMTPAQKVKTVVAAYAIGTLLKSTIGRDAGFNPIDAIIDAMGEIGKEEKTPKEKLLGAGQRLLGEVVDNTPVVPQLATMAFGEKNVKKVLGQDSSVGRYGVASPISSLVTNPAGLVAPFGAGQVKKTYQGIQTVVKGGIDNKDGERQVDVPQTPINLARGALFGKGAIPEVARYYENLGKKKADQKPVQNQIVSQAGTQSVEGLTKDQQERLASLTDSQKKAYIANVKQGKVENTGDIKAKFIAENKLSRKADKEFEQIKQTGESKKLSDGQYVAMIDGVPTKFKTKEKADQAVFENDFVNSDAKKAEFGNRVYLKDPNTEKGYRTQSKSDYEADKSLVGVAIDLDKTKAANNLGEWNKVADKKYQALTKKLQNLDPEVDFKEIDSINKQILDLQQEYDKYNSRGYISKGKGGSKGKKSFTLPSGFSLLPPSSAGAVSNLLKNAKVTYKG